MLDDNLPKMTTKDEKAYCLTTRYSAAEPKNSMERKQRTMVPVAEGQELPKDTTLVYDNDGKSHKPEHIGTAVDVNGHDILKRVYSPDGKSPTVNTCQGGNREPKVVVQSYREVRTEEAKKARREVRKKTGKDYTPFRAKELQPRDDGKVGTVTPSLNNDHKISLTKDDTQEIFWRKLTPLECERLQTVPDNYTNHVSNTRRYQMLGNGWTIEVITHILKNMELDNE